jgi:hypothetical protein
MAAVGTLLRVLCSALLFACGACVWLAFSWVWWCMCMGCRCMHVR